MISGLYCRYVSVCRKIYANDPLAVSDALSVAALHLFRCRDFTECLPVLTEILELRKKALGDYDAPKPHPRVADVYANLGLVLRLLGQNINQSSLSTVKRTTWGFRR